MKPPWDQHRKHLDDEARVTSAAARILRRQHGKHHRPGTKIELCPECKALACFVGDVQRCVGCRATVDVGLYNPVFEHNGVRGVAMLAPLLLCPSCLARVVEDILAAHPGARLVDQG